MDAAHVMHRCLRATPPSVTVAQGRIRVGVVRGVWVGVVRGVWVGVVRVDLGGCGQGGLGGCGQGETRWRQAVLQINLNQIHHGNRKMLSGHIPNG